MENCGNPGEGNRGVFRPAAWGVCSACTGDYEDPDRTAWRDDDFGEVDFEEEANHGSKSTETERTQ